MTPPDGACWIASHAAQIFIERGFESGLSINRIVISSDGGEVRIVVDTCEVARFSACGCDGRIVMIEQHAAPYIAVFYDAPGIIGAGQQIGTANHRPPSIGKRGSEESQGKECSQHKIWLRLGKRRRLFIQMISDDKEKDQGDERRQQRRSPVRKKRKGNAGEG